MKARGSRYAPVMQRVMPEVGRTAFNCPRCGAYAHQEWDDLATSYWDEVNNELAVNSFLDSKPDSFGIVHRLARLQASRDGAEPVNEIEPGNWSAAQCVRCREWSVWRDKRMVFPGVALGSPPHEEMPAEARELYEEAREVVGTSRRAGAALARAALERLLSVLDPVDGRLSLFGRIDHVMPRVSGSLAKMLTLVRHAGNESVHPNSDPDDVMILVLDPANEAVVSVMFESINDLVDELISKPRRQQELFEKLPENVRGALGAD